MELKNTDWSDHTKTVVRSFFNGEISKQKADELLECKTEKQEEKPKHWQGRYKPKKNGRYYVTGERDAMHKVINHNTASAQFHRSFSLCSQTIAEAEFVKRQKEAELEVIDRLAELNEGWKPDWNDKYQPKWEPYYAHDIHGVMYMKYGYTQHLPDHFQAKTEEIGEQLKKRTRSRENQAGYLG